MTQERIVAILSTSRFYMARFKMLQAEIAEKELLAQRVREDAFIAMASPKAQVITDMPHGSGRTDSAVEQLALRMAEGKSIDDYEAELKAAVARAKRELDETSIMIRYIEAWLDCLNDRERFVVEHQMCDKERWSEVVDEYTKQFCFADKCTLRRMRSTAIEKIMRVCDELDTDLMRD